MRRITIYGWHELNNCACHILKYNVDTTLLASSDFDQVGELDPLHSEHPGGTEDEREEGRWFKSFTAAKTAMIAELCERERDIRCLISRARKLRKKDAY